MDFNPTDNGQATSYRITARVQHPFPQFPPPALVELPNTGDDFSCAYHTAATALLPLT